MRKSTKIMAGLGVVAGLGVALAPLATYAADLGTDTITVTIGVACNMEADSDPTTPNVNDTFANTYTGTLVAGKTVELTSPTAATGKTAVKAIKVTCNDAAGTGAHGYYIKAQATALNGTLDTSTAIPATVDPAEGRSGWGGKFSLGASQGDMTISEGFTSYKSFGSGLVTIASGNVSSANGDILNIDGYMVSASASQQADTYTGHVDYTFVAPQA